ncbi:hypothetical protein GGI04_000124 [Coemansia thaxteri]|nr:hypothetical protein GGI04_000124 [Coemansia thaxteri]
MTTHGVAGSSGPAALRPDYMHRFRPTVAKPIISEVLRSALGNTKYESEGMAELTTAIGKRIVERLVAEPGLERYKFVVNVSIFQNNGQGARMGVSANWDPEADAAVQETFTNDSINVGFGGACELSPTLYSCAKAHARKTLGSSPAIGNMADSEWTDWRFSRDDLKRTPSVACGWSVEREELDRSKACGLIQSASRKLQLPQITSASACVYLHRFFMRHSLKEHHHYNIAATCLFIACKAEESLRKLDCFIPVIVYYASKGNRKAPPGTTEFEKWRAVILRTEVVVLQALCFDLVVEHPHMALVGLCDRLELPQHLSQMTWSFIADCLRLPVCLVYSPRSIACASVALAAKVLPSESCGDLANDSWLDRVYADRVAVADIVQWLLEFCAREAQSRMSRGVADHAAESAHTPMSSPGSTTSPMSHIQPSPLPEAK